MPATTLFRLFAELADKFPSLAVSKEGDWVFGDRRDATKCNICKSPTKLNNTYQRYHTLFCPSGHKSV